jgi:hypothetical protein
MACHQDGNFIRITKEASLSLNGDPTEGGLIGQLAELTPLTGFCWTGVATITMTTGSWENGSTG